MIGDLHKSKTYKVWCPVCKSEQECTEYLDKPGGYLNGVICSGCNTDRQIEHSTFDCHIYKQQCKKCSKEHTLLTQDDRSPEYYSTVGVICDCKEVVWFSLPVN